MGLPLSCSEFLASKLALNRHPRFDRPSAENGRMQRVAVGPGSGEGLLLDRIAGIEFPSAGNRSKSRRSGAEVQEEGFEGAPPKPR